MRKMYNDILVITSVCLLVSCEKIGLVEKEKYDSIAQELVMAKEQNEQLSQEVRGLKNRIETLENSLAEAKTNADRYRTTLTNACEKAKNLETIVNNTEFYSFDDFVENVRRLKESLGYQTVYGNTSNSQYGSRSVTITKQPDYLYNGF